MKTDRANVCPHEGPLNVTAKFEAGLDEVKNSVAINHALRKPPPRRIRCGTQSLICGSIRCVFFRCHQGTGCGLLDEMSDGLSMGQEHGVTALDLDHS